MRLEPVPTDNSSTQSNSSPVKKMLPTTSPEVTTPLVRRSSISASIESESLPISALVFKVSLSSKPSVVVPVPDSDPSSSRDSPSIMVRNPSSVSPSTHPHRFPPPLLSHTTPSSPPTLFSSTPMSPLSSMSLNSKPTWCHTQESISCFLLMPQSSPPRRPITSNSPLPRSPTPLSSQPL